MNNLDLLSYWRCAKALTAVLERRDVEVAAMLMSQMAAIADRHPDARLRRLARATVVRSAARIAAMRMADAAVAQMAGVRARNGLAASMPAPKEQGDTL